MQLIDTIRSHSAFNAGPISRLSGGISRTIKSFRTNKDGVAAVEFAVLSPVMIALYFGLVEISLIIQADKTVSHATNIAGDLATQVANIDRDDIEDVFEATLSTMAIKDADVHKVRMDIISYRGLAGGTPQQIGIARLNGGVSTPYDPTTINPRLISVGSGAVVARMEFQYESITYKFVEQFTNLEETYILKPRTSADIPFSTDGSVVTYTCTASGSIATSC